MLGLRGSPFRNVSQQIKANASDSQTGTIIDNNTQIMPSTISGDGMHLGSASQNGSPTKNSASSNIQYQRIRSRTSTNDTSSSTGVLTSIRDAIFGTRSKLIAEFDGVDEISLDNMSIESFLDFITRERLSSMPHRGSLWDRVLRWAEFYALQIVAYASHIQEFVSESRSAANQILICLRMLIELGESNAAALNTTFGVLYKLGLSLAFLISFESRFSLSTDVREDVGKAFNDMHRLVFDVASYYHRTVRGLSKGVVVVDFYSLFSTNLNQFYNRKDRIIEHMWSHSLGGGDAYRDVRKISNWLNTRSNLLRAISSDEHVYKPAYNEYTCEWFQKHLLEFTRGNDDVLGITAAAGSGKTVLASWIRERLQRPIDYKSFSTIFFKFETDIPSETTSLALAKSLSLQLLELRVGNINLFELLLDAYHQKDQVAVENRLWDAIDAAFGKSSGNTIIIVDGLDHVKGGDISGIRNRISAISAKHNSVKSIVLSKPSQALQANKKWKIFEIKPDHVYEDLRHITKGHLRTYEHYASHKDSDQRGIVEHIVKAANGNFLWTLLTINLLRKSKGLDDFKKNVHEVPNTPTLDALFTKYFNNPGIIDFTDKDTKTLFSLLLVTERPLTLAEIKVLLEIDTKKRAITERKSPIKDDVVRMGDFLLVVDGDVVRFRHDTVRGQFLGAATEAKKLPSFRDAQQDLTLRLLTFIKLSIPEQSDVTFDLLPIDDVHRRFSEHPLLEYSIRHWIAHLRNTSLYKSTGQLEVTPDFKSVFPSTPYMPLLEWTCWANQMSPIDLVSLNNTSLRVREQVLTEKHESTIQSLIVCAHADDSPMVRATYYYRASRISQTILEKNSPITLQCTQSFLAITDSMNFTSRTEIVQYREELIKYIITIYRSQKREDLVMRYTKTLAELYVSIKEESKATAIWKEIHQKTVESHGKGSKEEREISDELKVVLKSSKDFEIEHYTGDVFAITKDAITVVWDLKRILVFLQMAKTYEEKKEYYEAEYIFVTMWNRLLHMYKHREGHSDLDFDLRVQILKITIEYTRFLERRQRIEEARNVLIIVWSEYEKETYESFEFYEYFKTIATMMKSFHLHALSISVYNKISEYYRATGRHDHEEARSIRAITQKTIEEVSRELSSNSSSSSTDVETIVRRIGGSKVVTTETLRLARTQVNTYMQREEYFEAISQLSKTLSAVWNLSTTFQGSIMLPEEHADEVIEMTLLLASCHAHIKHYHETLAIYAQLWAAIRSSTKFEDERRSRIITILTKFYTEHKRWKLLVELQRTLLIEYRRYLGPAHPRTIAILYLIGDLCLEHGHGDASDYFREIIVNVGKSDLKVSFRAYKLLSRIYYDECRWLELKDVCEVLWDVFIKHHREYKEHFDTEFVELLYTRYMYVLQYQHKVEHRVLVTIATQYRETCSALFTSSSAITIRAMVQRATILMQQEETRSQAIEAYEEVITVSREHKSAMSENSLTAVKKSLSQAYVAMAAHSTTTSATSYQRAVTVLQERFEMQKSTLGVAHKETLSTFAQAITMIYKSKMAESSTMITKRLQETVTQIVTTEKRSEVLYEAASTIGSLYVMSLTQKSGLQLVHDIRRQMIMTQSKISRASFVFLVVLELTVRGFIGVTYSELMTSLLTETVLYESYTRSVSTNTKIEAILSRAAHLRTFWISHERKEEISGLDQQITELFAKQYGSVIQVKADNTKSFLINLLIYLGSREATDVQMGRIAIVAGDNRISELVKASQFSEAYEIGRCTFYFAKHQNSYHKSENIGYGFKLAGYMAGRGGSGQIPPAVHKDMLRLSREIMVEVLHACKELKVNFLSLHDHELNDLVELLGQQENYTELDSVLEELWKNRHGQKHWSEDTIIRLGKRLVQTRQLISGGSTRAIHLAEDITYNLRRVLGGLHPFTLEMTVLLSQLYTAAGQYGDTMVVHEDVLDLIIAGDDGNDRTIDEVSASTARLHVDLLRAAYVRRGGWLKSSEVYKTLVDHLLSMRQYRNAVEFKNVSSADKWNVKDDVGTLGTFVKPTSWGFLATVGVEEVIDDELKLEQKHTHTQKSIEGSSLRRISANWGMASMFGGGQTVNSRR